MTSTQGPAAAASQLSPSKPSPLMSPASSPWNLIVRVSGPGGQFELHCEIVPLTIRGVSAVGGPSAVRNVPPGVTVWVNILSAAPAGAASASPARESTARSRSMLYSSSPSLTSSTRWESLYVLPSAPSAVIVSLVTTFLYFLSARLAALVRGSRPFGQ